MPRRPVEPATFDCPLCGKHLVAPKDGRTCRAYGDWWHDWGRPESKHNRCKDSRSVCVDIPYQDRRIVWAVLEHLRKKHPIRECPCGWKPESPGFLRRKLALHLLYPSPESLARHVLLYAFQGAPQ